VPQVAVRSNQAEGPPSARRSSRLLLTSEAYTMLNSNDSLHVHQSTDWPCLVSTRAPWRLVRTENLPILTADTVLEGYICRDCVAKAATRKTSKFRHLSIIHRGRHLPLRLSLVLAILRTGCHT
jgi:hypothetical protein